MESFQKTWYHGQHDPIFFCINVDKLFQIYTIQKATKLTYLQDWILCLSQNARNIPEIMEGIWQASQRLNNL